MASTLVHKPTGRKKIPEHEIKGFKDLQYFFVLLLDFITLRYEKKNGDA